MNVKDKMIGSQRRKAAREILIEGRAPLRSFSEITSTRDGRFIQNGRLLSRAEMAAALLRGHSYRLWLPE